MENVSPPKALPYFTLCISVILMIGITMGNILIFTGIVWDPTKRLHKLSSVFVLNIATADFVVGVIVMPLSTCFHNDEVNGLTLSSYEVKAFHIAVFIGATSSLIR